MSRIALLFFAIGLAACGMKGPLEIPSGPAKEPLLGTPKATAASPSKGAADVSTDNKSNTQ